MIKKTGNGAVHRCIHAAVIGYLIEDHAEKGTDKFKARFCSIKVGFKRRSFNLRTTPRSRSK